MKGAVQPFLVIPDEIVERSPWYVSLSTGQPDEDPVFIENWDNGTDLTLSRSIMLDTPKIFEILGLPLTGTSLELVVSIGSGDGRLPAWKRIAFRQEIDRTSRELEIHVEIPGGSLADALHIDSAILLRSVGDGEKMPLAPGKPGDIVWRERDRIRLEGDISRFPISETDLGAFLGSDWRDALWFLEVDWREMSVGFGSAVRLHINSTRKEFIQRFRDGDTATLQPVIADVMVQIVTGFLEHADDHIEISAKDEPGSLSAVAMGWLELAFGSVDSARRTQSNAPGRYHAQLNALAALDEAGS